ncbi:PBP1A family penicillin-binding protein [Leptolyngbya sp. FACHB-711]|uniref:transglycosylase domain-containing protein n=1 Tax=unclassified Leptolyngbya TaxID=2650499 RepID=UPI00321FCD8C
MTDFFTKLKALSNRQPKSGGSPVNQRRLVSFASLKTLVERAKGAEPSDRLPNENNENAPHSGRRSPRRRPLYQQWWAWSVVGLGLGLAGTGLAARETIVGIRRHMPNTAEALNYVRNGTLTIEAADGSVLQQIGPATRDKVTLSEIPDRLKQAFIASEDRDFYQHDGLDYQAIARAAIANATAGEVVEGGSTITQQLARIVFLGQERSIGRKLREAMLAHKMEDELQKDQILERYLNLVYLGSGAYGVADAAWIYFSKPIEKLTLGEMAMIAGMPPAPSVYSPLVNPDIAQQRRDIVLQRMVDAEFITLAEKNQAMAAPIAVKPSSPKYINSAAPYFTSYIQQQLPNLVSKEELEAGGLTVESTLNLKWQKEAQATVNRAIENYGPPEGFEQAALVSVDPRNGQIKAMVGGNDFSKSQFNRATQAQRQPGSTFKTFVYSTAIAAGFSPYKSYMDGKYVVDGYEPRNYNKRYRGWVSMRDALISSLNIVAVKVLVDVGFDPVVAMAAKMGIQSKLLPAYSLALGSSEVNLLEITSAYGTLANKGNHIEAHGITRVFNRFGKLIYEAKFKPERAIDQDSASIMTWMLEGVVNSGTGGDATLGDRAVAGKTGTSEKRRDLWFIGYIPQLVTGVWMGNDDSSPTYGASSTAALTWYNFMSTLTEEIKPEDFPEVPQLDGRDGTIKAKPVNPRRVVAREAASGEGDYSEESSGESSWSNSGGSSWQGESYSEPSYSEPDYSEPDYSEPEPEPAAPVESDPVESTAPAPAPIDTVPPPEPEPAPAPIEVPPPVVVPTEPAPPAPAPDASL